MRVTSDQEMALGMTQASLSVMQRKVSAGRADLEARAVSPSRALRFAVEKAAADDLSLGISAKVVERELRLGDYLGSAVGSDGLLLLLGRAEGDLGMLFLDMQVLASLVEVQTIGWVLSRPAVDRVATETDTAIVAPFFDTVLTRFALGAQDSSDSDWSGGYSCIGRLEDRRAMGLALSGREYHVFHLSFDIADGSREGGVVLALPVGAPKRIAPSSRPGPLAADLAERLWTVPLELEGILCRFSAPLDRVHSFAVGDLVPLPLDALAHSTLEGGGRQGAVSVLMGQSNGMRALRIRSKTGLQAIETLTSNVVQGRAAQVRAVASTVVQPPDPATLDTAEEDDPLSGLDLSDLGFEGAQGETRQWEIPDLPEVGETSGARDAVG